MKKFLVPMVVAAILCGNLALCESKIGEILIETREINEDYIKAFDYLDAPVVRVNSKDLPLPYAPTLIEEILPNVERTVEAVRRVLYRN